MKIACQSCQAKYTIADEKVVGKVVKIRCKKCGTTIVVNGQEGAPPERDEATEVRSSSADLAGGAATTTDAEGWTVNVADNDQRTMTTQQVAAEFATGTITDETYCWRDGMGDWLPLREIAELAAACGLSGGAGFAQQAPAAAAAARSGSVRPGATAASAGGGLGGLFGSGGGSAAAQAAASGAAAARRGGRAGGADLFGAAAEAGGENDVMTSAPSSSSAARGGSDAEKMTGQRNENSVLFSLNALTANDPKKAAPGGGKPLGAAEGDGSGLIDIRALSSSMASSSGPKKTNHADDIMNLGGGGAFSAALAAPVLTAPALDAGDGSSPQGGTSNSKLMMMFGALAFLLVAGMVGMYFVLKPGPAPVATNNPDPGASAGGNAGQAPAATAPGTPAPATSAAATAPDPAATVAANTPQPAAPTVGANPGHGRTGGSAPVAFKDPTPSAPSPPPPSIPGGGSLEQQMAHSVPGAAVAPAAPAAPAAGSAPFDRGAAAAALGGIADGVGSCKKPGGPTGDGHVSITFSPSGSVVSAIVDQPPFAGTAVGGCVAGKFRGAHVPAFAGGNLTIGKRFSIN